jgi:hypothetical protein
MSDALPAARAARLKPVRLSALTERHRALIASMVFGVDDAGVSRLTRKALRIVKRVDDGEVIEEAEVYDRPLAPGEPLSAFEAAEFYGVRRRQVRDLLSQPIFASAMAKELQTLKNGEKARSLYTAISLRDDGSDNSAAAKKVRLDAAKVFIAEPEDARRPFALTINNVQQVAGYVIRLPSHEVGKPATIDARPNGDSAAEG